MKSKLSVNSSKRDRIRRRVRSKVSGTAERPRLSVFKSSKHVYAQLIDDINGVTLASCSSLVKDLKSDLDGKPASEKATHVGKKIAEVAQSKNITNCVFDRSGYKYHGVVKAIADGAREGGLNF